MAKTWTIGEATKAIQSGDKEAIVDIGKRFPLFAVAAAQVNGAALTILSAVPERVSVRVIESVLKDGVTESDGDADGDEGDAPEEKTAETAKPATKQAAKPAAASTGDTDYESKGAYPLYCLCKERGLEVKSKQPKEVYIAALVANDKKSAKPAAAKPAAKEAKTEADEASGEYGNMTAQELFKECKKRGIEVEIKKPAKHYIDKLIADDKKSNAPEDDGGWGDEDETPAAKPAKTSGKSAAKPAAKDDEEWDI